MKRHQQQLKPKAVRANSAQNHFKHDRSSLWLAAGIKKIAFEGPFKHRRSPTAYSFLSRKSLSKRDTKRQGPHHFSHVATGLFIETKVSDEFDFKRIRRRTRLRMSPGQENALLLKATRKRDRRDQQALDDQRLKILVRKMVQDYIIDTATNNREQARAFGAQYEQSGLQTYGYAAKDVTKEDLYGKGERTASAERDISHLSQFTTREIKGWSSVGPYKSIDFGLAKSDDADSPNIVHLGSLGSEDQERALRVLTRAGQMSRLHKGTVEPEALSESSVLSEHDAVYLMAEQKFNEFVDQTAKVTSARVFTLSGRR